MWGKKVMNMATSLVDKNEIFSFRESAELFLKGEMDQDTFKKIRLIQGVYVQRETNRYMLRVRIPWGGINSQQLERIADLTDIYSDSSCHITTRQNLQFYNMNLKQVCEMITYLSEVGITSREASGNVVRNIVSCHLSGVCQKECFDVTPYADFLTRFLIRRSEFQNLPRKFKISFSACQMDCGLTAIQDLGFIAVVQKGVRGFKVVVGGGLGAAPKTAQVLEEFIGLELLIPTVLAILSVFNKRGIRNNRLRARLKFLVEEIGIEEFKKSVFRVRDHLIKTETLPVLDYEEEAPSPSLNDVSYSIKEESPEFNRWFFSNCVLEKKNGTFAINIPVPLGEISSETLRKIAKIADHYSLGKIRTTNNQNLVIFGIKPFDLKSVYDLLLKAGLAMPCSSRLCDVTSCPGASTCPSAITNSKALTAELIRFFQNGGKSFQEIQASIKICGCPNSCGQHHTATLGLSGRMQLFKDKQVPSYELVLGGQIKDGFLKFAESACKIPSKRVVSAISRILHWYRREKQEDETLENFICRKGVYSFKDILESLIDIEHSPLAPEEYQDWGEDTDFQLKVKPSEC
ncbi:MAG: hypothetical protein A3I11_07040 [Elusimicrobia bacterium RIFCSPLOWO2_02_FULL_39_32]|nr:MAG: hypothetical protein A3B80_05585 [Elusimicrobia bacterium RIFCSPHIGHO2_02_FULL_39_36]OGR91943.1 MAG: hypothetical protein A3I11_07040 [Elusimicrobia bacterium RIFCSPLOWO2_02_FULL_39_32]OGR98764.1 MAG: hypothetical protein A3G85_05390 [Elusimicrobia bacterium RIFCSPLOWO2_12_FULL_39_28]